MSEPDTKKPKDEKKLQETKDGKSAPKPEHPIVFMDIEVGGHPLGRIKFELFSSVCPRTSENFRQLCTGEYRKDGIPQGYKGSKFHRVIKDFMIQGGDYVKGDGTGIASIYGGAFEDENFIYKHTGVGDLSMANSGANSNGCQFFVTCTRCDFLDGKHVVFGRLIDGLLVLKQIEAIATDAKNKPKADVVIAQCGQM
eukprot:gene4690-8635_t